MPDRLFTVGQTTLDPGMHFLYSRGKDFAATEPSYLSGRRDCLGPAFALFDQQRLTGVDFR